MDRLITFGCSNTFGHGLPDCFIPPQHPGQEPSKLAWPQILADKLNKECINMSSPGSSNLKILESILKFNFDSTDTVMVMWADPARDTIYTSPEENTTVAHWVTDSNINVKEWLKLHNEYDLAMRTWFMMHHAWLHLLPYTFYFLDCHHDRYFYDIRPTWADSITILKTRIDIEREKHPKALDDMHPGVECHSTIAEMIHKEITCK